jgi:hypothetical protein
MNTLLAEDFAKKVVVNYYGHNLPFSLTNDYFDKQKSIAEGLNIEQQTQLLINDSTIFTFIKEANHYAQTFKLDDIAYLMMVKKAADIITPKNEKYFAQQFTYAVLYNKGLDVILGLSNQNITVYGSTNFAIKNVLFVQLGSKIYYDLSFDQLKEPAQEKLSDIKDTINADQDWHAIFLNVSEPMNPQNTWMKVQEQYLTGAYILSYNGAKHLLEKFKDGYASSDWMTTRLQLCGHSYSYFPWLVIQEGNESTIGSGYEEDHKKVIRCLNEISYPIDEYI